MLTSLRPPRLHLPLRRLFCACSEPAPNHLSFCTETFAKRMAMAGMKPHHRIALGVSGGADSTALCALTARWKLEGLGKVEGVLGIVVDHKLREESGEEAELVRGRVANMGIECVVKCCVWNGGRPKLGHLQEAARDMRYQIFHQVCIEQQFGVLLIAHHADDQAELFVLRLSRNSGVLGLAGMAFITQLFPPHFHNCLEGNQGILLVRPMIDFSKDDMYKICEGMHQEWVEDPTNQRPLFARNRIRLALKSISSNVFRSEMQSLITACRLTRSFVQNVCNKMIDDCVTITEHGYAIIDLKKLDPSNVGDLCLSKFLAIILQFISQRQRPVRGSVSQLLLDYVRTLPCKTSLTAAGCYLCAAPRSKGTKILVCSHDSPWPATMSLSHIYARSEQPLIIEEIENIIMDAKPYTEKFVPEASSVHFLRARSSKDVLNEAKKLNLISDSTFSSIRSLQVEEHELFNTKEAESSSKSRNEMIPSCSSRVELHPGESCHFMNRFLVTWEVCKDSFSSSSDDLCRFCIGDQVNTIAMRHMIDDDWLYLAKISKQQDCEDHLDDSIAKISKQQDCEDHLDDSILKVKENATRDTCLSFMQLSAHNALQGLKLIPVSGRRALPVIVSSQDLLLSIPAIGFNCCPHLQVTAVFTPRVPIGGGYSSYV